MKDLYSEEIPDIIRTVRDDITIKDMQASLFINANKDNIKRRSFKVDLDKQIDSDNVSFTSEYLESFIDAVVRVYGDNAEKVNGYSFSISCAIGKKSLPEQAWNLMCYCIRLAIECGISIDRIAFGDATAQINEEQSPCVSVRVYVSTFPISSGNSVQISTWSRFRLFVKEFCRIIAR